MRRVIALIVTLLLLAVPQHVFGHASLVKAVPDADERLSGSPSAVMLTFNERLEDGLYYIKVLDLNKKPVTPNKTQMNADHTALTLDLPALPDGDYIVTYRAISADGHPIDGTYLFAVGAGSGPIGVGVSAADALQSMHHGHGGLVMGNSTGDTIKFASRILYFLSLLIVTGWIVWRRLFKLSPEAAGTVSRWTVIWQRIFLLAVIFALFMHVREILSGGSAEDALELLRTSFGYLWGGMLVLALAGTAAVSKRASLDYVWVTAVWLVESFNGHASVFEPARETLLLNTIHLAGAAIWAGGLVLLLTLWLKEREEAKRLLPAFSRTALVTISIVTLTGVLTALLFLPSPQYLLYTWWGKLLLIKTALVLLVVATALFIRRVWASGRHGSLGKLLVTDAVLYGLIAAIVGVFTYMSPLPANEPLNYHVMGETIHMTAQISPNAPGKNTFTVKVWLPEKLGAPKQVIVRLFDETEEEMAPIAVPVEPFEDKQMGEESYGMRKHSYRVSGDYLAYPGRWRLEVRVMDSEDNETVYTKPMMIY